MIYTFDAKNQTLEVQDPFNKFVTASLCWLTSTLVVDNTATWQNKSSEAAIFNPVLGIATTLSAVIRYSWVKVESWCKNSPNICLFRENIDGNVI